MNKRGLLLAVCFTGLQANNFTGHTFFSVRPQFQSGSPEKESLFRAMPCMAGNNLPVEVNNLVVAEAPDKRRGIQVVPFGGKTVAGNCHGLAQYFMPFGKTELIVGEYGSQAALNNTVDVVANYFGVLTANPGLNADAYTVTDLTFQSKISLRPAQSVIGCGLHYAQMLSRRCDGTGWWFDIAFPIEQVKNKVCFKEVVINSGGGDVQPGFVATVGDALRGNTVFGNKKFNYGKICAGAMKKTGVADVQIRLGYTPINTKTGYVDTYIGLIAPTGNKPCGEFIFEPIVGNNKHWGIQFGTLDGAELWGNDCQALWFEGVINGQFLFHNTQRRSFDLVDKQWSRYIALYPNAQATALTDMTPGINILTRAMRVDPRFALTMNLSLRWAELNNGFEFEGGYNFYGRQAERVCLSCPWVEGPGIIGIDPANRFALETKNNATISKAMPVIGLIDVDRNIDTLVSTFVSIKRADLNLASAAHPAVITHTLYGTAGYRFDLCEFPLLAALGGSYEFSSNNAGLKRWNAWGKVAVSL